MVKIDRISVEQTKEPFLRKVKFYDHTREKDQEVRTTADTTKKQTQEVRSTAG